MKKDEKPLPKQFLCIFKAIALAIYHNKKILASLYLAIGVILFVYVPYFIGGFLDPVYHGKSLTTITPDPLPVLSTWVVGMLSVVLYFFVGVFVLMIIWVVCFIFYYLWITLEKYL